MTRATTFRATAVIGGALLAMLMIMTVSRAAFSDLTSNDDNSVAAGTVVLYNDAPNGGANTVPGDETGDPMFGPVATAWTVDASNLTPGGSVQHCIETTYAGSINANVEFESVTPGIGTVPGFGDEINLSVERFSGACGIAGTGSAVASGTVANPVLGAETPWGAITGDSEFYLVTLELDLATTNTFQGAELTDIDFQWIANQA